MPPQAQAPIAMRGVLALRGAFSLAFALLALRPAKAAFRYDGVPGLIVSAFATAGSLLMLLAWGLRAASATER